MARDALEEDQRTVGLDSAAGGAGGAAHYRGEKQQHYHPARPLRIVEIGEAGGRGHGQGVEQTVPERLAPALTEASGLEADAEEEGDHEHHHGVELDYRAPERLERTGHHREIQQAEVYRGEIHEEL